jgi:hypothetical protein
VQPDANNALLALEHASDQELLATRHEHQQIRQTALEEHADQATMKPGPRAGAQVCLLMAYPDL